MARSRSSSYSGRTAEVLFRFLTEMSEAVAVIERRSTFCFLSSPWGGPSGGPWRLEDFVHGGTRQASRVTGQVPGLGSRPCPHDYRHRPAAGQERDTNPAISLLLSVHERDRVDPYKVEPSTDELLRGLHIERIAGPPPIVVQG